MFRKKSSVLPKDFLLKNPPTPAINRIDFAQTPVDDYAGLYGVVIDNIMSPDECEQLVAAAEKYGKWEKALINTGGGKQAMREDVRKCGRIMWDNQEVMDKLWARIEPLLPELQKIDKWKRLAPRKIKFTRLNERMRILKYDKGGYFKPHWDGSYVTPDTKERSYFTLHLYLNDKDHQPDGESLVGGATTFWGLDGDDRFDVNPKMGSVLIFQHSGLLHSGDKLDSGTKITLRTDLMYTDWDD